MDASHEDGAQYREDAESILRSITRSFDQVNIATEFLLLKKEPDSVGPELQLACLIKDRIARIEEQVTELYQILNRPRHTEHLVMTH
jgi:hypothetical protein